MAVVADTRDDAAVRSMVQDVRTALGGVDILVNAAARPAGGGPVPRLADLNDDALREEVETKMLGYLRCIRAAPAALQLLPDARQRGDPIVDQAGPVGGLEEGLGGAEQPGSCSCYATPSPDRKAGSSFGSTAQIAAICCQPAAMGTGLSSSAST